MPSEFQTVPPCTTSASRARVLRERRKKRSNKPIREYCILRTRIALTQEIRDARAQILRRLHVGLHDEPNETDSADISESRPANVAETLCRAQLRKERLLAEVAEEFQEHSALRTHVLLHLIVRANVIVRLVFAQCFREFHHFILAQRHHSSVNNVVLYIISTDKFHHQDCRSPKRRHLPSPLIPRTLPLNSTLSKGLAPLLSNTCVVMVSAIRSEPSELIFPATSNSSRTFLRKCLWNSNKDSKVIALDSSYNCLGEKDLVSSKNSLTCEPCW